MEIISEINQILDRLFGLEIISTKPKEAIKFSRNYFKKRPIIAIEIGVLRGINSKEILKNLNIEKLYLIDPWLAYGEYSKSEPKRTQKTLSLDFKICKKNLKRYNKKIVYLKMLSKDASDKVSSADFIYIDGNHEYNFVKDDLDKYWKKLKLNGILSGHDIQYPGVSKALIEFAKKNNLEIYFGDRRDWWIIKK